jgi:HAE1 family hydrophobic/amphiphilic exporter-1
LKRLQSDHAGRRGFDYSGMSYQEQQAEKGVPSWAVFGLSLLFVFLILAALYESWTLPFSVLLSTPSRFSARTSRCTSGSLENDIFATIGLVMLIGLSAKNAILIVEFAKTNYESGQSICEAALERSSASLPAHRHDRAGLHLRLPSALDCDRAGAASRRILGTVVIGGMTLSTASASSSSRHVRVVEYLSHRFVRGAARAQRWTQADFEAAVAAGKAAGGGPKLDPDPRRSGMRNSSLRG